jgi:hypothetical protein
MRANQRGEGLVVFVGPSLASQQAQRLAPGAQLRPPIAVGDLLAIARARRRPGCVAIIDGYFERMAAVWHKEILVAIDRGIAVWGAASMGALRAAELAPWGMIGVGSIYKSFVRGHLEADDEVAVAHLGAEHGFRPVSDALVNLRDGLRRAAGAGVIGQRLAAELVTLAQRRPYRERSWQQLYDDGTGVRGSTRALARLQRWVEQHRPDRKRDDARLLLRRLAHTGWQRPAAVHVPQTWALRQLVRLVDEGMATKRSG